VGLLCKRVRVDKIWTLVCAKQKNVPLAKKAPPNAGVDAGTKLTPSWFVGDRDSDADTRDSRKGRVAALENQ
jgi:hypothetical protein